MVVLITDIRFSFICPRAVFLRTRRSFTSRKLYVCVETFLCFLQLSDRSYVPRARCLGLSVVCSFWHHMIQMHLRKTVFVFVFFLVLSAVYPAAYAIVSYCLASFTFNTSFPVARLARQISCSFLSV